MQQTGEQKQKSVGEILEEMDLFAEDQREQMLEAFDVARQTCPVVHTKADGGYYVVTRYEDVRTVCTTPEVFSSVQPGSAASRSDSHPSTPTLRCTGTSASC